MRMLLAILWALAGAGLVMRAMAVPLAGPVLVIALSSLVVLYFLPKRGAIRLPEVVHHRMEVFAWSIARQAIALTLIGILFVVQDWPNGSLFLVVGGLGCLAALAIFWWVGRSWPEVRAAWRGLMGLLALLLVVAVLLHWQGKRIFPAEAHGTPVPTEEVR